MDFMRLCLSAVCAITCAVSAVSAACAEPVESVKSSVTTAAGRQAFLDDLKKNTIDGNLAQPLNSQNEDRWKGAFWGMEISLCRNATTLAAVKEALSKSSELSDSFTRSALEAACTLYPSEVENEVRTIARQTKNAKNFAMAAQYVVKLHPDRSKGLLDLMRRKFPDSATNPMLMQLALRLEQPFTERVKNRPPLVDLLGQKFPGDTPVVFSFQRCNRDYPGLAVVRKPDGTFLRRQDGSVFSISQLARAMSNCPGYLTNGNTPQGIFSIQGIGGSDNTFIGPTPVLTTTLPIEASVAAYFHDQGRSSEKWSKDLYKALLPQSWRNYEPIYEAYGAGEVGRGSIIIHGTTIYTEFYKGKPYYPNTPSMGCLCALEMWSPVDGHCIYSDQHALVDAYSSFETKKGYLVVVELDNEQRPVTLYDVAADLMEAEK